MAELFCLFPWNWNVFPTKPFIFCGFYADDMLKRWLVRRLIKVKIKNRHLHQFARACIGSTSRTQNLYWTWSLPRKSLQWSMVERDVYLYLKACNMGAVSCDTQQEWWFSAQGYLLFPATHPSIPLQPSSAYKCFNGSVQSLPQQVTVVQISNPQQRRRDIAHVQRKASLHQLCVTLTTTQSAATHLTHLQCTKWSCIQSAAATCRRDDELALPVVPPW